jgi:hypothetical protein
MRSEEIERYRQAITAFGECLKELLSNMKPVQASFLTSYPQWVPLPGQEERVAELRARASILTGPASEAVEAVGVSVAHKPSGTMRQYAMNPVAAWSTMLTDRPMIDAQLIFDSCNQALGRLAVEAGKARSTEGSLVGLVARFVSFPRRVREAAGLPPDKWSGRLATGLGIAAQVFVVVLGGLLLALLTKLLGLGH